MTTPLSTDDYKASPRFSRGILLILIAFILLAFGYSLVNPLYEATDELRHYRFVRILATEARLPVQGQEPCRSQSHHPPLFYGLGAAVTFWIESDRDICYTPPENPFWAYRYWEVGQDNKNQYLHEASEDFPWYGDALAVHIVRGLNVLIGAAVVYLTWLTGIHIWSRRSKGEFLVLGGAALVAFNPMFLYLSGAINNDVIAALAGAAVTYVCIRLLLDPSGLSWRWGFIFGLLMGLALLSKFNLLAIIMLVEAAVTWVAWKKSQWRQWLIINILLLGGVLLISGWWFARNLSLYGDPTGFQQVTELWGVRDPLESFGLALSEVPYAFSTLWGRFGFGQIPLPGLMYSLILALILIGFLGAVLGLIRQVDTSERWCLVFLFAVVILFSLVLFNYMLVSPAGPNGRFFFPALSALGLIIVYGIRAVLYWAMKWIRSLRHKDLSASELELRSSFYAAWVVGLGMLAMALVALFAYLGPAYAEPRAFSSGDVLPNPSMIYFDQFVSLVGFETSADTLRPGEYLDIELYWQVLNKLPGDYLLFVHLLDQDGSIVTQRDTHPGLGNFPSSQWVPGDLFVEEIRLYLPETAYTPADVSLSVGLYAPGAYRLAVSDSAGRPLGDAFLLSSIHLTPVEGRYPNPQSHNFNDEIKLVGYEYSPRKLASGEDLEVTLYWQALTELNTDYIVQVRLLSEDGQIVAAADGRPGDDTSPTTSWRGGDLVTDIHTLSVSSQSPPGSYVVDIALVDTSTNSRQNIVGDDGHWIDSHLFLAPIKVED